MSRRPWWLRGDIGRLVAGESVSAVGSQVTFLALPLAAVLVLHASSAAMGVLGALDNLPYLVFGLWVGVLVDRVSRRRLMVLSDLLRAVAVASVPVAAIGGWLTFQQLCGVVFIVGIGNIVFDVACQAHLPSIVGRDRLVAANGALQTSASLSMVAGPGLAGGLVQVLGAPVAIVVDAVSYLASAIAVRSMRDLPVPADTSSEPIRGQALAGLRMVAADRRLLGIAGAASTISLAMNAMTAVFVYYLANRLGLEPGAIGLIYLGVGVSGAAGAVLIAPAARRFGTGRVLALAPVVAGVGLAACTVTAESGATGAALAVGFGASIVAVGAGLVGFAVLSAGLRQALAPEAARGRVLGTLRFLEWGSMPVGSLLGGAIGELAGPAAGMWFAALVLASAALWIVATPVRGIVPLPDADANPA